MFEWENEENGKSRGALKNATHCASPHLSLLEKNSCGEDRTGSFGAKRSYPCKPHYAHHQFLSRQTSSNRIWRQVKVSNGSGVRQERLNGTVGVISTFRTPWHAINSCIKMLVSWHGRACSIHILVSILCSILNIARSVPLVMEKMCSSLGSQFCTKSCENCRFM